MLRISNLSFSYQDPVFQNLNLSFSDSEIVAVIGDNGIGKTTLLRLIAGELKPDEGSILTRGNIGFLKQTQDDLTNKSGGERTQIRLAEIFREHPDILLLDEPTNNLDSASKLWLRKNLQRYPGLVILVSHDRDFINQAANKILELSHDGAEIYCGNYTDFRIRKEQKLHEQTLIYETVQHEKRKLRQQLQIANDRAHKSNRRSYNKISDESRLRYNGQRMAAQNSAGKILRATKSKIDQLAKVSKPLERKIYKAEVMQNFSHSKKILKVSCLGKSYDQKTLFRNLDFEIYTDERVRIVGKNGAGKSTIFKIIMRNIDADTGEVWLAPNIKVGYISQDVMGFNLEKSFLAQNSEISKTEIYQAAMTMDLMPKDLSKPIENLSRGQITKLAILKLILQPLDLVILDEITNHLDIRARENVESALLNYHGAILAATHDESFARGINLEREIIL